MIHIRRRLRSKEAFFRPLNPLSSRGLEEGREWASSHSKRPKVKRSWEACKEKGKKRSNLQGGNRNLIRGGEHFKDSKGRVADQKGIRGPEHLGAGILTGPDSMLRSDWEITKNLELCPKNLTRAVHYESNHQKKVQHHQREN